MSLGWTGLQVAYLIGLANLFTSATLEKTIDILAKYAYHHPSMDAPEMPEATMKAMLRLCTKEAPFKSPQGDMYLQVDGIAMGSPMGYSPKRTWQPSKKQFLPSTSRLSMPAM